jgi:hypothetical protein
MEARNVAIAIADAQVMRRWEEMPDEMALKHALPGASIYVKLTAVPGPLVSYDRLRETLRTLELSGVLMLNIMVGSALQRTHVHATLDDLIRSLGWNPRSVVQRAQMRQKIWSWLQIFDTVTVHGKRPGVYRDPVTKEVFDLTSDDALIKLTGKKKVKQAAFSGAEVPIEVSWVAGPWLDQFRDNKEVLQYFGDISKIAAIPAGRPSGAWAQSIGMALNQLWRERGARQQPGRSGEENRLTVRFKEPFTRFELLDLFRTDPLVGQVLSSDKPHRAQHYWQEAIQILKTHKVISHYEQIDPLPKKRKGWQEFWLQSQRLDIRPDETGTKAIKQLSERRKRAQRTVARRRATHPA